MPKTIDGRLDDFEDYINNLDLSGGTVSEKVSRLYLAGLKVSTINKIMDEMTDAQKDRMRALVSKVLRQIGTTSWV